ncbi:hypothetical protein B0A55_10697 [Friedmanniomyces simplex]|uniref:Uncharacterized protein n=1 Tax=Friedmanniomyces simplex TaxID=329884 RepID=A0A4U0WNM8_9PEZI|nr:hypothetical protein B0A55_10697 [Friedmanniomyces simplex]
MDEVVPMGDTSELAAGAVGTGAAGVLATEGADCKAQVPRELMMLGLTEQARIEQVRIEQVRIEQARIEQARIEQARIVQAQSCKVQSCKAQIVQARSCKVQSCKVQTVQVQSCKARSCKVQSCKVQSCKVQTVQAQSCKVQTVQVQSCEDSTGDEYGADPLAGLTGVLLVSLSVKVAWLRRAGGEAEELLTDVDDVTGTTVSVVDVMLGVVADETDEDVVGTEYAGADGVEEFDAAEYPGGEGADELDAQYAEVEEEDCDP